MEKIITHPSTLSRLDCRLKYAWSREYRPRHTSDALQFGIAIHYALEQYYGHKQSAVEAYNEYVAENVTMVKGVKSDFDIGARLMKDYMEFYKNEKFKVYSTEMEIARRIPIPKDDKHPPERANHFYIAARIDAIVHDYGTDLSYVLEHKTFDKFYAMTLEMDHQFVIEKFVADGYFKKPIAGVIYNGIRKYISPNANTKTFERHHVNINQNQIDVMLHRAYWSLRLTTSDEFRAYPEPSSMRCNFCGFRQPCTEYMHGGDYQFLLDNLYESRENEEEDEWL